MTEEGLKLENDLCRCCQAEGRFKSLSESPRGEESYSEMLKIALDIELKPVSDPLDRKMYAICDTCIRRLEDADNFKQQVLGCERVFQQLYTGDLIKVVEKEEPGTKIITIKDESSSDEDYSIRDELMGVAATEDDQTFLSVEVPPKLEDTEFKEIRQSKSMLHTILVEPMRRTERKRKEVIKQAVPAGKKRKPYKPKTKKKKPLSIDEKIKNAMEKKEKGRRKETKKAGNVDGESSQGAKEAYVIEEKTKERQLFKCVPCNMLYICWEGIRWHYRHFHSISPRIKCQICLEPLASAAKLILHNYEKHNIDERFKCNACSAIFSSQKVLRNHLNVYHKLGERRKCQKCDFESYSKISMNRHAEKHKNVKDFHCKYCKKSFLRQRTLDLHERIHTGDRRKVCKECGQAFVQKASLNYHMAKHHPGVAF